MAHPSPSIAVLLNLVPDAPDRVLSYLAQHPTLSSHQDENGYSLVHAAASYAQLPLLRALVQEHRVDPNIVDSDDETALFFAETVEVAQCLIKDLGVDWTRRNADDLTAEEKLEAEDEAPLVVAFLRQLREAGTGDGSSTNEANGDSTVRIPPPLPEGLDIKVGTMPVDDNGEAPDPEFRRRIEELAAREDFQDEAGQRELRQLVTEAITGVITDRSSNERDVRRRLE